MIPLLLALAGLAALAPRAEWAVGARLGAGLAKLTPTATGRFPRTTALPAPSLAAEGRWAFHPVLDLRADLGLTLKGTGLSDHGHLAVWSGQGGLALAAHLGRPTWPVRPWLAVGPYLARRLATTGTWDGAPLAEPDAPFVAWDWGLTTAVGVDVDRWGQRWAVDLRLETGLADLANPAWPPFAEGQTMRQQALSLGLGWRWGL
ncbi:MAG: hypothetical protein KC613_20380 [Myxococcales bacterium]|nr:hypothetical protein [Myxococcales bacterium]